MRTGHGDAFKKWFSAHEVARKRQKIAPGRKVPGFPEPPPGPGELAALIDTIGQAAVMDALRVHRSTLARWLDGSVQMPHSAFLLLRFWSAGLLPGMGDDWRGFRFDVDRLTFPDGREYVTALELQGRRYQRAHLAALEDKIKALRRENAHLLRVGDFDAANDPLICVS